MTAQLFRRCCRNPTLVSAALLSADTILISLWHHSVYRRRGSSQEILRRGWRNEVTPGVADVPLWRFRDTTVKLETSTQPKEEWESCEVPMSQLPRNNQFGNALKFFCIKWKSLHLCMVEESWNNISDSLRGLDTFEMWVGERSTLKR